MSFADGFDRIDIILQTVTSSVRDVVICKGGAQNAAGASAVSVGRGNPDKSGIRMGCQDSRDDCVQGSVERDIALVIYGTERSLVALVICTHIYGYDIRVRNRGVAVDQRTVAGAIV